MRKNRLNFYACAVEPDKGNIEPQCKKQPDEIGVVQRGGKFVDLSKAPDHAPDCPGQEKQHGDAGSRVAEIKEAETPDHLKEQLAEKQPSGFKRFGGAWFAENKIIGESHKQIQNAPDNAEPFRGRCQRRLFGHTVPAGYAGKREITACCRSNGDGTE